MKSFGLNWVNIRGINDRWMVFVLSENRDESETNINHSAGRARVDIPSSDLRYLPRWRDGILKVLERLFVNNFIRIIHKYGVFSWKNKWLMTRSMPSRCHVAGLFLPVNLLQLGVPTVLRVILTTVYFKQDLPPPRQDICARSWHGFYLSHATSTHWRRVLICAV